MAFDFLFFFVFFMGLQLHLGKGFQQIVFRLDGGCSFLPSLLSYLLIIFFCVFILCERQWVFAFYAIGLKFVLVYCGLGVSLDHCHMSFFFFCLSLLRCDVPLRGRMCLWVGMCFFFVFFFS